MNHAVKTTDISATLATIDVGMKDSLRRLFEILEIPSIGTDPAYDADCVKAARWTMNTLAEMGFKVDLMSSTGQPMVVAQYSPPGGRNLPHLLFYGHYDVQPADPLELWTTPPFAPQLRTGPDGHESVYARGAADDKGQFMTFVEAMRATIRTTGSLPFRATVLIEGDEEGDATHVDRFIRKHKDLLKADVAFICDTGLWQSEVPALVTSLRGCIAEEVEITGPRIDLHSGYYGGPAVNPIKVLSRIMGEMHDAKGRITIPGFYKGIRPVSAKQKRDIKRLRFDDKKFLGDTGLKHAAGEREYSALEQLWYRPTADVNGIWGGYTGAGTKTVLPSKATAKISFRLVAGQSPTQVRKAFRAYVKSKLPKDCRVKFGSHGGDAGAVAIAADSPWIKMSLRALKDAWELEPVLVGEGCSIPIVESFEKHLKMDSVLMGFGCDSDQIHSPDENYRLNSFTRGIKSWAVLFDHIKNGNQS